MVSLGELRGILSLEDRFTPTLKLAASQLSSNAEKISQIGSKLTAAGATLTAALTVPIIGFGTVAATTFANFEREMNRVQAVSQASASDFAKLEEQAKMLGATTAYTAQQAADGMGFLAMAGFKATQILGAMPSVLQLAASAQMDVGRAADITSNILTGYNMQVEDLGRVNDVLVKSFTSANTDLEQLGQAFKYAGPVAKAAGVDFETAAATLALMGNAGIQASMAGTSLRGAITQLLNPTKKAQELMNELGFSAVDSAGKLRPLDQIIQQLEPHAENAGAFMEIFGQRAGPAMAALVGQGSEALRKLDAQLRTSGGMAESVAKTQMEGLKGAWVELESATEGVSIAIGEVLAPALTTIMKGLTEVARFIYNYVIPAFNGLPSPVKAVTLGLVGFVAILGPMLATIGLVTAGIGSLAGAMAAIQGSTIAWRIATTALSGAVSALGYVLPVVGVGIASWSIGRWIGDITGATDGIGKLTARLGEFIGLLPKGTAEQYAASRAAVEHAKSATAVANAQTEQARAALAAAAVPPPLPQLQTAEQFLAKLRAQDEAAQKLTATQRAQIAEAIRLGAAETEIATALDISEYAVVRYAEKLDEAAEKKKKNVEAAKAFADAVSNALSTAWVPFATTVKDDATAIHNIMQGFEADGTLINNTLQQTAQASAATKEWANSVGAVLAPAIKSANASLEAGASAAEKWIARGQSLSNTILKAIRGGGNVGRSIGADLGGQLGNELAGKAIGAITGKLTGKLGGALAGAIGSSFGPIGTMIGGWLGEKAGGLIGKLFGGDKEKKQVEKMRQELYKTAGGLDQLKARAAAAGVSLDRVFNAKKVEDFKAAVEAAQNAIVEHQQRMDLARQAADEFGIPAEKMSEAFKQADTDMAGLSLYDKITALMESGLDLGTLVEYAGDDVARFIQRAMEMGTTVPLEFKKIAEEMMKAGKLQFTNTEEYERLTQQKIDLEEQLAAAMKDSSEEGMKKQAELKEKLKKTNEELEATTTAFDDLDDIPWATNLNSMFEGLMTKLSQFIDLLTNGLGGALDGLPRDVDINFNARGGARGDEEGNDNHKMATGGVIVGRQTVTAGETGPEAIIPLHHMDSLFPKSSKDTEFSFNIYLDGKKMTDVVIKNMGSRSALLVGGSR